MTDYVWQLGIDWNAIQTGGVGYLRGGLTTMDHLPLPGTNPVQTGDQITFRIFDVSSSAQERQVAEIASFGIDSQAAVKDQMSADPLNDTHPIVGPPNESIEVLRSSLFSPAFCSWDVAPVEVADAPGRFLLTVYLQAKGTDGVIRLFNHDPEMAVGPNG